MFIASVLAFCAGIYLEAILHLPVSSLFFLTLAGAVSVPFLIHRANRIAVFLILACFLLAGSARLAFLNPGQVIGDEERGDALYEAAVVESSPRIKVLSLSKPVELKGMRAVFLTAPDLQTGQEVRIFGRVRDLVPSFNNPGTTSWKWLKRLEGITYEVRGRLLSVSPARHLVARMRSYFKGNIEASLARHTDILKALTIGDRTSVPEDKNNLFLRTGTSHVLAISGFNVGIISGFFFLFARTLLRRIKLLRMSGRDTRYASLLTIPFPFIFMFVAGAGVSVIRATIMIIVFMLALFLEREKHFYNTMALAALIILILYPHSLFTPSFQLTFLSLLFIVMFMEKLLPLMQRLKKKILTWSLSTILSTAAATLGTAPIVIYYFYGINPFCLVHNLVTIPLIGVAATTLSLMGMAFPYGHSLLLAAGMITDVNIRVLQSLDFGYLYPLVRPTFSEILLYYGLVLALLYSGRRHVAAILFFILIPLSVIQVYVDYRERFNEDLRIHFIDVGMGDATLIEAPGGMRMLIDGGGFHGSDFDVGKYVITPFLLSRKVLHIDYVVNTHPHDDHAGGLPYILRHFSVSNLVTSGPFPSDTKFLELERAARERGIPHLIWKRGEIMKREGDFRITVLHPARGSAYENLNNSSLVLKIGHGDKAILLPGDIDTGIEEKLALSGAPLRADVLKLAHHGSASSNSFAFIEAVGPQLAVLSAARGTKNLPGAAAVQRYTALSIPVLSTYGHGLVEIRSDGKKIRYRTYRQFVIIPALHK